MPDLTMLQRIADAKFPLVVCLLFAVTVVALVCAKLYRDKCRENERANQRIQEIGDRALQLTEKIYERYVADLRYGPRAPQPPETDAGRRAARRDGAGPEAAEDRHDARGNG